MSKWGRRRTAHKPVTPAKSPSAQRNPTPVQAAEWHHARLSTALTARSDRFSQLLGRLIKDEHEGQYLKSRASLSEAEYAELRSLTPEAHKAYGLELSEAIQALRRLLARGDPLYAVALVQLKNLFGGWGKYYEPTHEGSELKVELVCGLLATQPVARDLDAQSDDQLEQIFTEIDHVQEVALLFNLSTPRDAGDLITTLRVTGAMHWMFLRGSSFAGHGRDLARAVYGPHDSWLLAKYGFSVADVLDVGTAVEALINERINKLLDEARRLASEVVSFIGSAEAAKKLPREVLKDLRRRIPDMRTFGGPAFFQVIQTGVREALSFSPDEIRLSSGASRRDRIASVLAELSVSVGTLDSSTYTGPYDPSPLVQRPYLEFNGRYLLAIPGMVIRDTVALLEDRFMDGKPDFSRARAKTLDTLAVQYLGQALPGSVAHTNLRYENTELDGLVLFEDTAFVVEGKGTPLSVQGHRGDVKRLQRDIGRAVEDAWKQGARARDFVFKDGDAVFQSEAGGYVRIPSGSIREVFIVNPTLHELGGHAPQLGRLRALGLFPSGEMPWSVYINDLRVIAETCGNPAIFLHYLTWRGRLPLGERISAMDEIDLWGSYLNGERFGMLADSDRVIVGNSSTDFDAYYDGLEGRGPKRARPEKLLSEPVKSFVERMAAERPRGWRHASGACLELSIPELAMVSSEATQVARFATGMGECVKHEIGRVAVIGLPQRNLASSMHGDAEPSSDATVVIYCHGDSPDGAEIVWARYAKPVTFALSSFEKAAFNASEASPFAAPS